MAKLYQITNLVVTRGSENSGFPTMNAAWGVTGGASWGYGGWYDEEWHFNASKNMSKKVVQQTGAGAATGDIVWTRGGENFHDTAYCCYNRNKYHPMVTGRYLKSVTLKAMHGQSGYGEMSTSATYTFKVPKKPVMGDVEYDSETHDVTFNVDAADEGPAGNNERYDTLNRILRQDSANRNNTYKDEKTVAGWTASTETSMERVYKLAEASALPQGQWVKLTFQAYSRGLAGDSEVSSQAYVFAHPAQAQITKITCSGLESTDYVTVKLKTNVSEYEPVDTIKLQRLRSSAITTAAAAGLASGWEDVSGAVDDGNCVGLTDLVQSSIPTVKTHTWYRLVTTHGAYTRNSVPVEATCLYRAKSPQAGDVVKYASVEPGSDGVSIVVRMAWNSDSSNTTQITWSEHEDAWESTEQPNSCDVTWEDATPWKDESVTPNIQYQHSATVTIRGLEEATEYYIRARRAFIDDENPGYGDWCPAPSYPVSTATAPEDVVLTVPAVVERGSGIDCSWTFNGSEQTAWEMRYLDGANVKVIAAGEGPAGATVIPAEKIAGMDSISIAVAVTSGGEWASSGYIPVSIDDAPELSLSVSPTLTAQPLEIELETSNPRTSAIIYVTSHGVSAEMPDGSEVQADGDVVWAESVSPAWSTTDSTITSSTVWTATVIPPILKLYEGASYTVSGVLTDTKTLLSSDMAEDDFEVAWAHRAVRPASTSTIAVSGLTATITPAVPTSGYATGDSVAQTDVVDIYRNTPDGAYLIASDVPFGQAVTDRFAPFSKRAELSYILCTRTADGDVEWGEYEYTLNHATLRVDFGQDSVELPYNLAMTDGWEKGFELREHLDGTRAGYWNEGATRKATLSTDVVKVESAEQRRLLAALAQHAGPCFVRTPDGCAYPADVEVDSYGVTYESAAVPVSITATEVAITDAFRIAPTDWGA